MYTRHTYEDWQIINDKRHLLTQIIGNYKASDDFARALEAQRYFNSDNTAIQQKYTVQLHVSEREQVLDSIDPITGENVVIKKPVSEKVKVQGTRIASSFLFRFITQENQHLLGNGVTIKEDGIKQKLGNGFDTVLAAMGEHALTDGVCWGFWNVDHLEEIRAVSDGLSGAVALVSEMDSKPRVLIQFWQLASDKAMYVRVFEPDGITVYKTGKDNELVIEQPKRAYKNLYLRDAAGEMLVAEDNYPFLPVVALYANPERRSELTEAIKSKIDCFDRVASDFGDNLEMANDIYWALNNFGGNEVQALQTLQKIHDLRAVINHSDGTGNGSTAEPHTFEVPYEARKTAMDILRKELYRDAMALDLESLSGSTLSTEAIETAAKELNLKCDRFEWQVFAFVQNILLLQNIVTEGISFKRQSITNATQVIENIYRAAEDLDQETRLKLNPMIADEDIPAIMQATAAERATGLATMEQLQAEIDRANEVLNDGQG